MTAESKMPLMRNPVLVLTIALPLVAVVASFISLGLTLMHPDSELPEQYHWEGFQLDRDFSRGEQASSLGVRASLQVPSLAGQCQLELKIAGTAPGMLDLMMAHATNPALDRQARLHRVAIEENAGRSTALYSGPCAGMSEGHWRLELSDAQRTWSVRESVHGSLEHVTLDPTTGLDD